MNAEFLEKANDSPDPAAGLPIWMPPRGEAVGFHRRSHARALAAGLQFSPVADTVRATLAWFHALPAERREALRAGISRDTEAALLARFRGGKTVAA